LASLTLVGGLLPAAISYLGKLIVDAVVFASQVNSESNGFVNIYPSLWYVGLEAIALSF
jgi:ATP-binding cassette subfamily B protein